MKGRSTKTQTEIANKMTKLNMDMGVFVGHKIYWREPNLTSGDKGLQDEFVNNIKDSIDVSKKSKCNMDDGCSWSCRLKKRNGISNS